MGKARERLGQVGVGCCEGGGGLVVLIAQACCVTDMHCAEVERGPSEETQSCIVPPLSPPPTSPPPQTEADPHRHVALTCG